MNDKLESFCRNTRARVTVCSMHFFHSRLSKAKNGSALPLVTGGNWKKSPVMTNCGGHTSSLKARPECNRDAPVCRRTAVLCSFVDFGRLTRGCRISGRPPWKLRPIYSNIAKRGSGIEVLTLVNDQNLSRPPPIKRGLTRPYALDLFIEVLLIWLYSPPRMDSHTCRTWCNRVRSAHGH